MNRTDLIKKIKLLDDIKVISISPPYKIKIKVGQQSEFRRDFKSYFNREPQQVPKIIHQVWIGPHKPPWQWIDTFRKNFTAIYPDWEYRLWREDDIKELNLINRDEYRYEEILSGKVNILRYEILYQYGGIYIDADCEWINNKSLQNLIDKTNETGVFAGWEDENMLANSVIGSSVNNPLMYYAIKLLGKTFHYNRRVLNRPTWISTGPRFFSECVLPYSITAFPKYYFYPISWHRDNRGVNTSEFIESYMIQYGYSTNRLYKED